MVTTVQVGGTSVYASENYRFETVKTLIGTLELPETTMTATIKTTNVQVQMEQKHHLVNQQQTLQFH